MDINTLVLIVVTAIILYIFIKLIVSPLLKIAFGVVIFIAFLYILQKFFNFNLNKALGPFSVYVDTNKWATEFDWLITPVNNYTNQVILFLQSFFQNIPKIKKT